MNLPTSDPPSHVLLVEGLNDKHVVWHIRDRLSLTLSFQIHNRRGVDPLLQAVGAEIIAPGRQVVGILMDANDELEKHWEDVKSQLSMEGIRAPSDPDPAGTIIDTLGKPRVGIWLMPDNVSTGELEDFVAQMIPGEDPVWPLSRRYIVDVPKDDRKFAAQKIQKAQVHAWLATRKKPGLMGLAIRTGDLNVDGSLCQKFVAWLTNLFG